MTVLGLTSPLASARIYMALAPVDMRKGFDGLAMVAQDSLTVVPDHLQQISATPTEAKDVTAKWIALQNLLRLQSQ